GYDRTGLDLDTLVLSDPLTVGEGAVRRAQVPDPDGAVAAHDLGVAARNGVVGQDDVAVDGAAHPQPVVGQVGRRCARQTSPGVAHPPTDLEVAVDRPDAEIGVELDVDDRRPGQPPPLLGGVGFVGLG